MQAKTSSIKKKIHCNHFNLIRNDWDSLLLCWIFLSSWSFFLCVRNSRSCLDVKRKSGEKNTMQNIYLEQKKIINKSSNENNFFFRLCRNFLKIMGTFLHMQHIWKIVKRTKCLHQVRKWIEIKIEKNYHGHSISVPNFDIYPSDISFDALNRVWFLFWNGHLTHCHTHTHT